MADVTLTITTLEGVIVYVPPARGNSHKWVALRKRKDGSLKKSDMPKRFVRAVKNSTEKGSD